MTQKYLPILGCFLLAIGCYSPERNCRDFRDGSFTFSTEINGETKTTTFVREGEQEIDYYEGQADTSSVRWLNDCEYVVKKLHPQNISEEQSIHMKILSTTADSYTFEYRILGSPETSRGTAYKTH